MTSTTDLLDGRYRLVRLLGQGGMSDVYEAVDERSDTAVAIKFVRSADPELARRFAQEVRALGRVEHPGLVRLIGTGLVDDHAYLVMELVQGSTLAEALRHGPLGPERTAYLGASLAGALAYVHSRGVVHRDVKPSNILLHADGRAQLGDFGVARLLDASALTMAGTTLGTAAYMAPEQLEDHQVGAGADVWSLGMVLLECLTGQRVYEGSTAQVVAKRMAGPVPLPGDLPVPWKLLLSGMLDHRPEQRLDGADIAATLVDHPVPRRVVAVAQPGHHPPAIDRRPEPDRPGRRDLDHGTARPHHRSGDRSGNCSGAHSSSPLGEPGRAAPAPTLVARRPRGPVGHRAGGCPPGCVPLQPGIQPRPPDQRNATAGHVDHHVSADDDHHDAGRHSRRTGRAEPATSRPTNRTAPSTRPPRNRSRLRPSKRSSMPRPASPTRPPATSNEPASPLTPASSTAVSTRPPHRRCNQTSRRSPPHWVWGRPLPAPLAPPTPRPPRPHRERDREGGRTWSRARTRSGRLRNRSHPPDGRRTRCPRRPSSRPGVAPSTGATL